MLGKLAEPEPQPVHKELQWAKVEHFSLSGSINMLHLIPVCTDRISVIVRDMD